MNYRVEYNGEDIELSTLDAALDNAKQAIADDMAPISGWTVEHDETINDWFVQGVRDGSPIGPTAVVSGPEPTAVAPASPGRIYATGDAEDWARRASFTGADAVEVFDRATSWLAAQPTVRVSDVAWQAGELRIYYR